MTARFSYNPNWQRLIRNVIIYDLISREARKKLNDWIDLSYVMMKLTLGIQFPMLTANKLKTLSQIHEEVGLQIDTSPSIFTLEAMTNSPDPPAPK